MLVVRDFRPEKFFQDFDLKILHQSRPDLFVIKLMAKEVVRFLKESDS